MLATNAAKPKRHDCVQYFRGRPDVEDAYFGGGMEASHLAPHHARHWAANSTPRPKTC